MSKKMLKNNMDVSLTLVGDFFCSTQFNCAEREKIENYLSVAPNPIINFEGSFEAIAVEDKAIRLAADPTILNSFNDCVVSLANNHVLDYREEGLNDLILKLNSESIPYFGINSNLKTYDNFKIVDFDGIKVCLVGFGAKNEECVSPGADMPGVLDFNKDNLKASFEALHTELFDYLIVYSHIGYEFEKYPLPLHVGLCREAIDLGADLVYCSHTHCLQPYEVYNGKYIFYGLGNFYFSSNRDRYPTDSDIGAIVRVSLSHHAREVNLVGVERIVYERPGPGFEISSFEGYQADWKLDSISLKKYSKNYSSIRTRKSNPRPILYYDRPILNFVKYRAWKLVVDITGVLGIRYLVKRMLRWQ